MSTFFGLARLTARPDLLPTSIHRSPTRSTEFMKILIAECRQEVSSFNPVPSGLDDFIIHRGEEMLDSHRGRRTEVGGALEVFAQAGAEVVGTYSAQLITSGGILDGNVWDQMSS